MPIILFKGGMYRIVAIDMKLKFGAARKVQAWGLSEHKNVCSLGTSQPKIMILVSVQPDNDQCQLCTIHFPISYLVLKLKMKTLYLEQVKGQ